MRLRFVYRALKARYRDERMEIGALLAAIRPGDCVVDVGANKGSYLYWLQRAAGPSGRVFAYEPQPRLASYLSAIGQRMAWSNVTVRACALSDRTGRAQLTVPEGADSPAASLGPTAPQTTPGSSHSFECELDTLDHQLQNETRITFLKVDVEGHEWHVFRGAEQILARHRPILLFECEARHLFKHTMADVFGWLTARGYAGQFFSPAGLRPVAQFDPSLHQRRNSGRFWDAPGYCNNFLFKAAPKS